MKEQYNLLIIHVSLGTASDSLLVYVLLNFILNFVAML